MNLHRIVRVAALSASCSFCAFAAHGEILNFTINWASPAAVETFELNTADGAPAGNGFLAFSITDDSDGQTVIDFGDTANNGQVYTEALSTLYIGFYTVYESDYFYHTTPLYSGTGSTLDIVPGENYTMYYGSTLVATAATAPASAPEPGAWTLMIVGFGAVGSAMRLRRRTMIAAL